MQDGESSTGIEEFLSEWVAECSSEAAAVASLDFSALMGVAGPRDGVHRPVLLDVAATRPARNARTRSRATLPRGGRSRAAAQPVGVVDLLPASEAGGGTATTGASVAELEDALEVRHGAIEKPASRWHHRPKRAVRDAAAASSCASPTVLGS